MILLIDTINDKGCIGFYDGKKLHTKIIESNPQNNRKIVKVIDDFVNRFKNKNLDFKVEAIGVINGPGSFTGVRTGVTIANAAAYALKVPVYAVDTLTAHVGAPSESEGRPNSKGAHVGAPLQIPANNTISLLSASNSEVYFARFNQGKMEPALRIGGGKIEIVNIENNLKNRLKKGDYIVGDLKCEHTQTLKNIQYSIFNINSKQRIEHLLQMIIDKKIKPIKQTLPLYIKPPNISKPKK